MEGSPISGREPHRLRDLTWPQWAVAGAVLGVLAVTAGLLVQTLHADAWTQIGDEANQVHGAQQAFRNWPLLGDLNTANFYGNPLSHHPGPVAWYLLAPWVRLLGPQMGGWLFAVAINLASIVIGGWFAFRSAGSRVALVALVALPLAYTAAVPGTFASMFFQYVVLLPLGATLICCWAVARGDTLALPIAVFGATFAVQSATVGLPLVACAGIAACASLVVEVRSGRAAPRHLRWHLGATAAIVVVTWAPPVWDQLTESGNFAKLATADIPHVGLPGIGDLVRSIGGSVVDARLVWLVGALVVAFAVHAPRRLHRDRPLAVVVAAMLVGAAITAALLPADDVESSHQLWFPMVSAFLGIAASAWVLPDLKLRRHTALVGVALAFLALGTAVPGIRTPATTSLTDRAAILATDAVLSDVLDALPPGKVQVTHRGAFQGTRLAQALLPRLEAAGHPGSYLTSEVLEFDGPTLLTMPGTPEPWQAGDVVAVFQAPPQAPLDADLAERIDRFARSNGPLVLRQHAEDLLPLLVDGEARSLCVDDLLAQPDDLLELGPLMAAKLYAAGLVASPTLPDDITAQIAVWQAAQPLVIRELPPQTESRDDLVLSTSSC